MGHKLEYDHENLSLRKAGRRVWSFARTPFLYLLLSLTLTVILYAVLSPFVDTAEEKALKASNERYGSIVPRLERRTDLVRDAITDLQYKDNDIYDRVFHAQAPSVDPMSSADLFFASDTIPDASLVVYAEAKADDLLSRSDEVERMFRSIVLSVADSAFTMPPMTIPVGEISYPQVGASTGMKINPFYKAYVAHKGMDFLVPMSTPVLAAADGVVASVSTSNTQGKVLVIDHAGGYSTLYAHLESVSVSPGQKVRCGRAVASVGMSGKSYAPHLHFEVLLDGVNMDPAGYIFASVDPEEYANMLYMAEHTTQSMD